MKLPLLVVLIGKECHNINGLGCSIEPLEEATILRFSRLTFRCRLVDFSNDPLQTVLSWITPLVAVLIVLLFIVIKAVKVTLH